MENSAKGTFRRRTWHLHCDPNPTYPPGMLEASKHKHSDSSIKSVRLTLKLPRKNIGHQQKEPQKCKYIFFGLPAEHDNLGCGDTLFWGPCNKDPII